MKKGDIDRGLITVGNPTVIRSQDGRRTDVHWADVQEVIAFKEDGFSFDTVVVALKLAGVQTRIVITEDDVGFNEFIAEMERQLHISHSWYAKVLKPPFRANMTRIFPT